MNDSAAPRILSRAEHPISRGLIDRNALKVLYRLQSAGYKAYLVGGGVRDLLLGRRPKDFDVSTDARPPEIRRLFRNARIIGRRFRLAHILFQDGVVEVSTFRREPTFQEQDSVASVREQDQAVGGRNLLITSDNTFGTPRQDAYRRDFTVNALFYNIADFTVIDYLGGIEDLENRLIRAIGDPGIRFQEDPVRMMRACEFAGRLSFAIERETQVAINAHRKELLKASPARLTEELIHLLRCGQAGAALQWMLDLGLLEVLLPEAYAMLAAGERGLGDFGRILPTIDQMAASGRELLDTGLLAAVLLPGVLLRRHDVEAVHQKPLRRDEVRRLIEETVAPFLARFTLSNLKAQQVFHALVGFSRMCEPGWTGAERVRFAHRPNFVDALWLFELLVEATGEGHAALADWQAAAAHRGRTPAGAPPESGLPGAARRPRRRRRRK